MGVVYEAVDLELGRRVALKLIAPEHAADRGFRERFVAESRLAASIEHPAVLPIYRAAEADGVLFLAMRLIAGHDLAAIVRHDGPVDPERAAGIVAQIAGALDAAHARGLVHRDVKPANVLIDADDRAYLTDFGLAKDLGATAADHTRTGDVLGTPDYLAPEQIRGDAIGPWTDIYALGCLLFFVLTGRVVFPLERPESKLWAHLSERPPSVSAFRDDVPAAFDDVLQVALAKSSEERFQTASALMAAACEASADRSRGPEQAADMPAAGGGVPERVHGPAVARARQEAVGRLEAAATRAAAVRRAWRRAESELASTVIALETASERRPAGAPGRREGRAVMCPFKGLAAFEFDDRHYFFGRERLIAELVARMVGAPLLGIVGASGSGKSSLLRAGLLPALAAGVLPGSERWARVLMRPGEHPASELQHAIESVAGKRQVVLAVDQFEETFTACRNEPERRAFINALVKAAHARDGRCRVIVAIRGDFYEQCAAHAELSRAMAANHALVGAMGRDELRVAIEGPAKRAGLCVEAKLVEALLNDVEAEPGALPLLSTALLELWRERDGRWLRLAAYEREGGVGGAVARLAERAFGQLGVAEQAVTRQVLVRLAGTGAGDAVVARRLPLAEFGDPRSDGPARVVAVLADRRLLTLGAGTVEVAHEALLREWPRLRGWLEEDAKGRRVHRQLADAAREWDEQGRDPGELYGGARLALALEWRAGHEHELNSTERAFLDASRTATGRAQRRLRLALAGVAALLVIAALGAVIALHQRNTAQLQAQAAQAQRLGIQALTETDLDRSLLLARQGVALDDSPATRSNLLTALLRAPAALGVIRGTGNPLQALDLSPNGRTLAAGDSRGTVLFFDVVTRRRIGPPYKRSGEITALRYSNDGSRLAVIGYDLPGPAAVDLVDARTHRRITELFFADRDPGPNLGTAVFSSDSRVVAAAFAAFTPGSRTRQYIQRWNVLTGRRLGPPRPISAGALVGFIAGSMLPVAAGPAGRETDVRDAATLRLIRHWRDRGAPASVSPDGRSLAYGARDGSVQLVDLRTGKLRVAVGRHDAPVTAVRFAPSSRALVSAAADGRLIVWDVKRGTRSETLENPSGGVSQLAIARDGRTAYTAGQNGSMIAWDLSGKRRLGRRFHVPSQNPLRYYGQGLPAPAVAASPDGGMFVIPERTGYADLFDSQTLARIARIRLSPGAHLIAGAIAPDGQTIVAATDDGELVFADLRTHRPLGPPIPADNPPVVGLAFSRDGRWLTTNSGDTLAIWDAQRRTFVRQVVLGTWVNDVSLSPDGTTLTATVNNDNVRGGLNIVPVPRLNPTRHVPAPLGDWGRYSRDGRLLLYGDRAGRAWLFDTRTWRPHGKPLIGHTTPVLTVNLSPNGQTLATTSLDGTARLWDVASGRAIGPALPGVPDHPVSGAFVSGGRGLVTVYDNGRGYLWDVQPESWARQACEVAGRTLTHDEWQDVLPERDYAPACVGA
jgi:WD40 repeat protein